MAGNLFDVFVVGATDPSAAGETRLAAALSAKHGVPLATVAKAISAKNLRAGQGLEQPQAQALVRHLQSIGAVTVIRPAAGARAQVGSPSGQTGRPATSPAPARPRATMSTPTSGGWPSTPPPASTPAEQYPHLASPLQPAAPAAGGGPDPFQPRSATPVVATAPHARSAGPAVSSPSHVPGSGLNVASSPGMKLELARDRRGPAPDEEEPVATRPRPAAPNASAASLREVGMTGASGVSMDEDPRNLNLVRCVQHGLYYDKAKASGCRKCMSPAREVASKMAQAAADASDVHVGNLRNSPAKRAFLGLAFSLVLGFMPAAYYCFGPGAAKARELRVEQELLGRQPGTDEVVRQFDSLDRQVSEQHEKATRNTAIVWIAITSVSMLGWYKIT